MDKLSKEQRSRLMGKIRGKDTKEEVRLSKSLWSRGHRYRKHDKSVMGTPDLCFRNLKLAIFIDSEFFHGKDFETKKKPVNNAEFWDRKIRRNMERDNEVNVYLIQNGWTVLRFWSDDVRKNLFRIVQTIEHHIRELRARIHYKNPPL